MCDARYLAEYPLTPVLHPSSFEVSVCFDTAFDFYSAWCKRCYLESFFFPGRNIFSVNISLATQSEMFLVLWFYSSPADFQLLCILGCRQCHGETSSLRLICGFLLLVDMDGPQRVQVGSVQQS